MKFSYNQQIGHNRNLILEFITLQMPTNCCGFLCLCVFFLADFHLWLADFHLCLSELRKFSKRLIRQNYREK